MCRVSSSVFRENDSLSLASPGLPEPSVISLFIVRVRWLWPPRCWARLGERVLSPAWESWDFPRQSCVPLNMPIPLERDTHARETLSLLTLLAAWPLLCHTGPSVISERLQEHPVQDFIPSVITLALLCDLE